MADEWMSWDLASIEDDAWWASAVDLQKSVFGRVVIHPEMQLTRDDIAREFRTALGQLTPVEFAQFNLMTGMHPGGPFHPLGVLTGHISMEACKWWRTRPYQADSIEEQEIRTHLSLIDLFGQLAK